MGIYQAIAEINDKAKFKSAYYFSIKDVHDLTSTSIGKCYENAITVLNEGGVPKLSAGLREFPDDAQLTQAVLDIFERICEAADAGEIQDFYSKNGILSIIEWMEIAPPDCNFGLASRIIGLAASKNSECDHYLKFIALVIEKCSRHQDLDNLGALIQTASNITSTYDRPVTSDVIDVEQLIKFIQWLHDNDQASQLILPSIQLLQKMEIHFQRGLADGEAIIGLLDYTAHGSAERELIAETLSTRTTEEEIRAVIQNIVSHSNINNAELSKLMIMSFNNATTSIIDEQNCVGSLLSIVKGITVSKINHGTGICNILGVMAQKGQLSVVNNQTVDTCITVMEKNQDPEVLVCIAWLLAPLIEHEACFEHLIKNNGFHLVTKIASSHQSNEAVVYSFSKLITSALKCPSAPAFLLATPLVFRFIEESITNQTLYYVVNGYLRSIRAICSQIPTIGTIETTRAIDILDNAIGNVTVHTVDEIVDLIALLTTISNSGGHKKTTKKIRSQLLATIPKITVKTPTFDKVTNILNSHDIEGLYLALAENPKDKYSKMSTTSERNDLTILAALAHTTVARNLYNHDTIVELRSMIAKVFKHSLSSASKRLDSDIVVIFTCLFMGLEDGIKGAIALSKIVVSSITNTTSTDALVGILDCMFADINEDFLASAADDWVNEFLSIMLNLFSRTNDSREIILITTRILKFLITRKSGVHVDTLVNLGLIKELADCCQKLKMWADIQYALLSCIEKAISCKSQKAIEACHERRLVDIIKFDKVQHARNKELKKLLFRISYILMPSGYMEDYIKELLTEIKVAFGKKNYMETNDLLGQLHVFLNGQESIQFCFQQGYGDIINKILTEVASFTALPDFHILMESLTETLNATVGTPYGLTRLVTKANAISCVSNLITHMIFLNANVLSNYIESLLTFLGKLISSNLTYAEAVLPLIITCLHYLSSQDYSPSSCDSVASFVAQIPVTVLLTYPEFSEFITLMIKNLQASDNHRVATAILAIRPWVAQPTMARYLQEHGVESALYRVALSNYAEREGCLQTLIKLIEYPLELNPDEWQFRIHVMCTIICESRVTTFKLDALHILSILVTQSSDKSIFETNITLIKAYGEVMESLWGKHPIEAEIAALSSVLSAEDIIIFLLQGLQRQLSAGNRATLASIDMKPPITELLIYLQLRLKAAETVYNEFSITFSLIQASFEKEPEFFENNINDVTALAHSLLKNSELCDEQSRSRLATMFPPGLTQTIHDRCKRDMDINSVGFITTLVSCPATSQIAIKLLSDGSIINGCFRTLADRRKPSALKVQALHFISKMSESIEGHHMNMRGVLTLYGTKTTPVEVICTISKQWCEANVELSSQALVLISHFVHRDNDKAASVTHYETLIDTVSYLSIFDVASQAAACSVIVQLMNTAGSNDYPRKLYIAKITEVSTQVRTNVIPHDQIPDCIRLISNSFPYLTKFAEVEPIVDALEVVDLLLQNATIDSKLMQVIIRNLNKFVTPLLREIRKRTCPDVIERVTLSIVPHISRNSQLFLNTQTVLYELGRELIQLFSSYEPIYDLLSQTDEYAHLFTVFNTSGVSKELEADSLSNGEIYRNWNRDKNKGTQINSNSSTFVKTQLQKLLQNTVVLAGIISSDDEAKRDLMLGLKALALLNGETTCISKPLVIAMHTQADYEIVNEIIKTVNALCENSPAAIDGVWNDSAEFVLNIANNLSIHTLEERIHRLLLMKHTSVQFPHEPIFSLLESADSSAISSTVSSTYYLMNPCLDYTYMNALLAIVPKTIVIDDIPRVMNSIQPYVKMPAFRPVISEIFFQLFLIGTPSTMTSDILKKLIQSQGYFGLLGKIAVSEHAKRSTYIVNWIQQEKIIDLIPPAFANEPLDSAACCSDLIACGLADELAEAGIHNAVNVALNKLVSHPRSLDSSIVEVLVSLAIQLPNAPPETEKCIETVAILCARYHAYSSSVVIACLPTLNSQAHIDFLVDFYSRYPDLQQDLNLVLRPLILQDLKNALPKLNTPAIHRSSLFDACCFNEAIKLQIPLQSFIHLMNTVPSTAENIDALIEILRTVYKEFIPDWPAVSENGRPRYDDVISSKLYSEAARLLQVLITSYMRQSASIHRLSTAIVERLRFEQMITILPDSAIEEDDSEWDCESVPYEPFVPLSSRIPNPTSPALYIQTGVGKSQLLDIGRDLFQSAKYPHDYMLLAYIAAQKVFSSTDDVASLSETLSRVSSSTSDHVRYLLCVTTANILACTEIQSTDSFQQVKKSITSWSKMSLSSLLPEERTFLVSFTTVMKSDQHEFTQLAIWNIDLRLT